MRAEMRAVAAQRGNGAWAPSCLAHAGNLGFASSPTIAVRGGTGHAIRLGQAPLFRRFGQAQVGKVRRLGGGDKHGSYSGDQQEASQFGALGCGEE